MKKSIQNNFNSEDFEIDGTVLVGHKGKGTDVVIPNFITEIATCVGRHGECYSAFNTGLRTGGYVKSITVPKSLTHIDGWTFYVCFNLEQITVEEQNEAYYSEGNCIIEKSSKTLVTACKNSIIPQDIKHIADHALVNCGSGANLTYNGTKQQWSAVEKHADWDEGGRDLVVHCADGDFTVDDAPFRIKGTCLWAYRGHSEKVVIPDGVRRVLADTWEGMYCFEYCGFMKSITVPKSLDNIDGNTFYGCFDLEEIIVDSQNPNYYSQDNCVIEKASKKLVVGCKTSVIPGDVKIIGNNAFYGCKNLTGITVPSSVKSIEPGAFNACNSLTSLFYKGNTKGFNKISVGHDNAPVFSATVYFYSETAPATEGNYWRYDTDGGTPVVW